MTSQLTNLATRIPADLIEEVQGESYAAHHVINQLLLYAVGPFSFERVDVVRGDVLSRNRDRDKPSFSDFASDVVLRNVVVGATYRLTLTIDGRREVAEETGDVEHPENWQHDGARLKDAASDALKRCAMRFGLGLHLWSQRLYKLDGWLAKRENGQAQTPAGAVESEDRPAPAPAGPAPQSAPQATATGQTTAKGRASRARTQAAAEPATDPAAAAPAPAAPAPPAGAPTPASAEIAATIPELCDALGITINSAWMRLRKTAKVQGAFPPAQADKFKALTNLEDVKALAGEDFKLAKAFLLDEAAKASAA